MPGRSLNFPSERDEGRETPGHHPARPPQKMDRRRAGGERGSGRSAKHGTGPETRRSTDEVDRARSPRPRRADRR
jgi:hypothetical protein